MGIVRAGPPVGLIEQLRKQFDIRVFVETGTYEGDTAAWAAMRFERVITVELSKILHRAAAARLAVFPNVDARLGDSRTALRTIVEELEQPALFWCDAHWSGGVTSGEEDQCPLLEEIAVIRSGRAPQYLLIDDARMFVSPVPPPHRAESWPSLEQVLEALRGAGRAPTVIVEDVVVSVPDAARDLVAQYCIAVSREEWQKRLEAVSPTVRSGSREILRGVEHLFEALSAKASAIRR